MKRKLSKLTAVALVVALSLCSLLCFTIPSAAANKTVSYTVNYLTDKYNTKSNTSDSVSLPSNAINVKMMLEMYGDYNDGTGTYEEYVKISSGGTYDSCVLAKTKTATDHLEAQSNRKIRTYTFNITGNTVVVDIGTGDNGTTAKWFDTIKPSTTSTALAVYFTYEEGEDSSEESSEEPSEESSEEPSEESSVESSEESSVESSEESSAESSETSGGDVGGTATWHANANDTGYVESTKGGTYDCLLGGSSSKLRARQYSAEVSKRATADDIKGYVGSATTVNKTMMDFIIESGDLTADDYIEYVWDWTLDGHTATAGTYALGTLTGTGYKRNSTAVGPSTSGVTFTVTAYTATLRIEGPLTVNSADTQFEAETATSVGLYNKVMESATLAVTIHRGSETPAESKGAVNVKLNGTATDIGDVVTGATGLALSSNGGSTYVAMTTDATGVYTVDTLKASTAYSIYWTDGTNYTQIGTGTVTSTDETPTPVELNYYTVTAEAADAGIASVSGSGNYLAGTQVTLTATPATGKAFSEWKLGDTQKSTSASYQVTVSAQETYTAYAVALGQATVNVNKNDTAAAIGTVVTGATGVALSIDGTSFIPMSGDNGVYTSEQLAVGTTYTVYVTKGSAHTSTGKTVTAVAVGDAATPVVVDYYTVTLTAAKHIATLSINGATVTDGAANAYLKGSIITLGATADVGRSFGSWMTATGDDLVSPKNAYQFTLNGAVAYKAVSSDFDPDAGSGGGEPCTLTINTVSYKVGNGSQTTWIDTPLTKDYQSGDTVNVVINFKKFYRPKIMSSFELRGMGSIAYSVNMQWYHDGEWQALLSSNSSNGDTRITISFVITEDTTIDNMYLYKIQNAPATSTDTVTLEGGTGGGGGGTGTKNKASIALNGAISVNFKLDISNAAGGTIELLYNHNTTTYGTTRTSDIASVDSLTATDGVVAISISMLPAQICDPIDIVVKNSDGEAVFTRKNFSIKQYCDYQIAQNTSAELTALCKAIVKYGAASQTYFDYNAGNLATAGGDYGDLSDVSASYASGTIVKGTNVQSLSATMVAGSGDVSLRFNFVLKSGEKLSASTYDNTGIGTASYGSGSGREYIAATGIAPTQFGENVALTVTGAGTTTITYSVYNFAYAKAGKGDATTSNFGKALYTYGEAATAYVNSLV